MCIFINFYLKNNLIFFINIKLNLDYNYRMKTIKFFIILNIIILLTLVLSKKFKNEIAENFQDETQTPEMSDMPEVPLNPDMPEMPDMPDIPDTPLNTNIPEIPEVPINVEDENGIEDYRLRYRARDTLKLLRTKCPNLNINKIFPKGLNLTESSIHPGAIMILCSGNWIKYNRSNEFLKNFDSTKNHTYFFDTVTKKRYKLVTTINSVGEISKELFHKGQRTNINIIPNVFKWNKYIQSYDLCPNEKPIRCNNMCVKDESLCDVDPESIKNEKPIIQPPPTTQAPTTQAPTPQATPKPIIKTKIIYVPIPQKQPEENKNEVKDKIKEIKEESLLEKVKKFFKNIM